MILSIYFLASQAVYLPVIAVAIGVAGLVAREIYTDRIRSKQHKSVAPVNLPEDEIGDMDLLAESDKYSGKMIGNVSGKSYRPANQGKQNPKSIHIAASKQNEASAARRREFAASPQSNRAGAGYTAGPQQLVSPRGNRPGIAEISRSMKNPSYPLSPSNGYSNEVSVRVKSLAAVTSKPRNLSKK